MHSFKSFLSNELEPVSYLIYMVAVLLYYNRFKLLRHRVLLFYYAGAAIVLYAGIVITSYLNNWTYNMVYFAKISVLSWYFGQVLHAAQKRTIVAAGLFINILLFIYFDIVLNTFYTIFNSFVYGVVFLSIILYALLYLHQILVNIKEENLLLNFDFWLVCGYLLHCLGSFVVVIYYQGADIYKRAAIWTIQNIILFICAAIMMIAVLRIIRKRDKPDYG